MARSYAAMTTLIRGKLNQSATTVFSVDDVNNQITDSLKELSTYAPHLVPIVFQVESRFGACGSTSANNLIDSSKGQFASTDDDNEKVVHNTTDNTYAVISSFSSTAQVGLTADIFVSGENYRIYNKQCWNSKQIYLGGLPEQYDVESVEYPIGQKRNWRIFDQVLELEVDTVEDSNAGSTVSQLPNVDVLVRFNKPHVLSPLTDTAGKMAATAAAAATSISLTSLQGSGTINVGEEFTIQYHRSTYIVAASATIASSAATVTFYPPLERAIASTAQTITFRMTSLRPEHEDIFANHVAGALLLDKATKYANSATTGRDPVYNYTVLGNSLVGDALTRLKRMQQPKVKRRYPSA